MLRAAPRPISTRKYDLNQTSISRAIALLEAEGLVGEREGLPQVAPSARRLLEGFLLRYAAGPMTYSWEWERVSVAADDAVAWLLAEGIETATRPGVRCRRRTG